MRSVYTYCCCLFILCTLVEACERSLFSLFWRNNLTKVPQKETQTTHSAAETDVRSNFVVKTSIPGNLSINVITEDAQRLIFLRS